MASSSPGYQKKLNTFIKRSIAQATASTITYEQFKYIQIAKSAQALQDRHS